MLPSIFGENLFDEFFDDAFDRSLRESEKNLYGKHAGRLMKTDIREQADSYELDIDLPGFQKEDLNLSLKNGYLTISASKHLSKDDTGKNGRYIRQERYMGSCARSFYVGDLRAEEIKAKYDNGVLSLTLPKPDAQRLTQGSRICIE